MAKSVGAEFGVMLVMSVWRNESTVVPVGPDGREFVGRSQLKVKISPPKVGEICRGRIWSHFSYLVLAK
jgi:hypothetical protein